MHKTTSNGLRRTQLQRKLRAINGQQVRFDAQTERLIKLFTKKQ